MSIQEERSLWKSVVSQAKRGQGTKETLQSICDQVADLVTEFLALMNKSCLVGSVDDGNFEERNHETAIMIRNCLGPLFGFSDSIDPIAVLLDEDLVEELLENESSKLVEEEENCMKVEPDPMSEPSEESNKPNIVKLVPKYAKNNAKEDSQDANYNSDSSINRTDIKIEGSETQVVKDEDNSAQEFVECTMDIGVDSDLFKDNAENQNENEDTSSKNSVPNEVGTSKRRRACGKCAGCLLPDCRNCKSCLNKSRFKKKCLKRVCEMLSKAVAQKKDDNLFQNSPTSEPMGRGSKRKSLVKGLENMQKAMQSMNPCSLARRTNNMQYNPDYPVDEETFNLYVKGTLAPQCPRCKGKFIHKYALVRHWIHRPKTCYEGVILGESLWTKNKNGPSGFCCAHEDCRNSDKVFTDKIYVHSHWNSVHGIESVPEHCVCDICGKKFVSHLLLERHTAINHRSEPVKCPKCPSVLANHGSYMKHVRKSHLSTERSIHCEHCPKTFFTFDLLRDHQKRNHRKELGLPELEKKFACEVCGKAFKSRSHFKDHIIIHAELDEKFKCKLCGKQLKRAVSYNRHMMGTHGIYVACHVCQKQFVNDKSLNRHLKFDHEIEVSKDFDFKLPPTTGKKGRPKATLENPCPKSAPNTT